MKIISEISCSMRSDKKLKRDKHGYYTNIPVLLLDKVSSNNTQYTSGSFIKATTDPDTLFNKRLKAGELIGELDHPEIFGLTNEEVIHTLAKMRIERCSALYRNVKVVDLPKYGKIVLVDVKPHGKCGPQFEEKMEDPSVNCSFSVRSLSSEKIMNGIKYRNFANVFTFDTNMALGGFKDASKKTAIDISESLGLDNVEVIPSSESLAEIDFDPYTVSESLAGVGMESCISIEELKRLRETIQLKSNDITLGIIEGDVFVDSSNKYDLTTMLFK